MKRNFQFFVPVTGIMEKAGTGGAPARRFVTGVISTDDLDVQGERVMQSGLDIRYLLDKGVLKYEHDKKSSANIIGFPLKVEKGEHTTQIVGELFAPGHAMADSTWNTLTAYDRWNTDHPQNKKSMGWSVEGSYKDRNDGIVKAAQVHNVVVTPNPVNTRTYVALLKSLAAGSEQSTGMTGGAALRTECSEGAKHRRKNKHGGMTMKSNEAVASFLEQFGQAIGPLLNKSFVMADEIRKSETGDIDLTAVDARADDLTKGVANSDSDSDAGSDSDSDSDENKSDSDKGTKKSLTVENQIAELNKSVETVAGMTAEALSGVRRAMTDDMNKAIDTRLAPVMDGLTTLRHKLSKLTKAITASGMEEIDGGKRATGTEKIEKSATDMSGAEMIKSLSKTAAGHGRIADILLAKSLVPNSGVVALDVTNYEVGGSMRPEVGAVVAAELGSK